MGLLDELLRGAVSGGLGQAMGRQQSPAAQGGGGIAGTVMALLPVVLAMLNQRQGGSSGSGAGMGGGLGGILEQFQRAGYGEQARSWVGTGSNLPISPDAIAQVFGRDGLGQIAASAGLSEQQASAGLTEMLPDVVDRLTPQGSVPDLDSLAASVGDLERRFGL